METRLTRVFFLLCIVMKKTMKWMEMQSERVAEDVQGKLMM